MSKVTLKKVKHPRYKYRVSFPDGGKRVQRYFSKKTGKGGADEFVELKSKELAEQGRMEASITQEERRAVMMFRDAGCDTSLTDAVSYYLKHLQLNQKAMTCEDVTDKLLHRLEKEKKSHRHILSVKHRLNRFNAEYGDRLTRDISLDIVDDFLGNLDLAPKTVINYRLSLSLLFSHAMKLKACRSNPVTDALKPKINPKDPCWLEPHVVASFLSACDVDVVAGYAIAFFAGLRSSEVLSLDWGQVNMGESLIGVRLDLAKSSKRRLVEMSDNLRAWLLPYAKKRGKVVISEHFWNEGRHKAMERIGMGEWKENYARHSFASYHVAHHKDAARTAFALGHPNPKLLYSTYRALVTPKAAATYWSIVPEEIDNVTDIKAS